MAIILDGHALRNCFLGRPSKIDLAWTNHQAIKIT